MSGNTIHTGWFLHKTWLAALQPRLPLLHSILLLLLLHPSLLLLLHPTQLHFLRRKEAGKAAFALVFTLQSCTSPLSHAWHGNAGATHARRKQRVHAHACMRA